VQAMVGAVAVVLNERSGRAGGCAIGGEEVESSAMDQSAASAFRNMHEHPE
jgi:hypothetical protein